MPYVPIMPRRGRGFRRGFRRRRRNWQWVRQVANSTTVISPPSSNTFDLLSNWKSAFGFSVNLPDIVIWRVRLKVSIRVIFPATLASQEADGVIVTVYTQDNNLVSSFENPITSPYAQQFMLYDMLFSTEQAVQGGIVPVASGTGFMYREYDIKAHRRLANINHTLLMTVAPSGGLANVAGIAYQTSILMKVGI